jgi:hypothetical protein
MNTRDLTHAPLAALNNCGPYSTDDWEREESERLADELVSTAESIERDTDQMLEIIDEDVLGSDHAYACADVLLALRRAWPAIEKMRNGDVLTREEEGSFPALWQTFKGLNASISECVTEEAQRQMEDKE